MGQFIDFPEDQNEQITDVTIVDEDDNSTEGNEDSEKSGEQLLLEALERYKNPDNAGDYSVDEDEDDDQDSESDEDESDDTDEEDEDEEEYTPNQEKSFKTQQNAVNAERRRQEQQRKLDDFRQTTPEYQIISQLANQRGVSPEQMLQEVQEAMLTQQAQQQGIPVEFARQLHEANQRLRELENQTALREYQELLL
jgi:FtsZ-interacting cell division protein ZipA